MDAVLKCLNNYELVEAILLQLPLYDLALIPVVCKTWSQVVATSPVIRARLLHDRLPFFVHYRPGKPDSDDLCNASKQGPWLFRTAVRNGMVMVLKTACFDLQLFLPDDVKVAARWIDPKRTRGAFHVNQKIRRGWANFYDRDGKLVCRRATSSSPWSLPAERLDSLWDFLRNFNEEENWRYRLWVEKVCEGEDWEKLLEIQLDKGYWL